MDSFSENRFPGLLLLGLGCENHEQASAFHLWLALFDRAVAKHLIEAGHDVHADLAVRDLASAEADGHLDFVAVRKELDGLLGFDLHIANVDGCGKARFLELDDLLILPLFLFALAHLKAIFAVVHELADRGIAVWRDFDQIQFALVGHFLRRADIYDAELVAIFAD